MSYHNEFSADATPVWLSQLVASSGSLISGSCLFLSVFLLICFVLRSYPALLLFSMSHRVTSSKTAGYIKRALSARRMPRGSLHNFIFHGCSCVFRSWRAVAGTRKRNTAPLQLWSPSPAGSIRWVTQVVYTCSSWGTVMAHLKENAAM